jgi:hypothetical protein
MTSSPDKLAPIPDGANGELPASQCALQIRGCGPSAPDPGSYLRSHIKYPVCFELARHQQKPLGATVLNAAPFATHCSAKLALSLQNDSRHFQNRINVAIVVYKSWRPDPSRSASARV